VSELLFIAVVRSCEDVLHTHGKPAQDNVHVLDDGPHVFII